MHFKKLLAFVGLASFASAQNATNGTLPTLQQALNSSSNLTTLNGILMSQPSLAGALGQAQNITIFAPNNAAIATFLNTSAGMMATQDQITAVLSYHVLMGAYPMFNMTGPTFVPTMLTNTSYANVTGGQRVEVINTTVYSGMGMNSSIVQSVNFTGGVIHIINRLLTIPGSVSSTATAYNLTSFYGALNASMNIGTANNLANSTFFVPNNAAFQAIGSALPNLTMAQIQSILTYHVVQGRVGYSTRLMNGSVYQSLQGNNLTITINNGSAIFVNSARVIIPNILVAGGVMHVIDQVLNPNMTMAANSSQTAGSPAYSGASSASGAPYTSGQPTPTASLNTGSIVMTATGGASATSSSGAAAPRATGGSFGAAAALGGLALIMQL